MAIGDLVPFCGSMRYKSGGTYSRLKNDDTMLVGRCPSVCSKVEAAKITFSISLLRRFRDAYVESMLYFAEHVAHLSNGHVGFLKKIQDDVQYLTASPEVGTCKGEEAS